MHCLELHDRWKVGYKCNRSVKKFASSSEVIGRPFVVSDCQLPGQPMAQQCIVINCGSLQGMMGMHGRSLSCDCYPNCFAVVKIQISVLINTT